MNRLKFEGKGFDFFKIFIVDLILAFVSLTLLYPRAIIREARYLWSEATLDGTPFEFHGKTKTAFNGYIKFLLFFVVYIIVISAITFLLSRFFKDYSLIANFVSMVALLLFAFVLTPLAMHGDLRFFANNTSWRSVKASYKGRISELSAISLRGNILSLLTLGIYSAWYETQLCKYLMEHLRFGSLRFSYSGVAKELFKIRLKGFLLGLVTLGIYNIWYVRDLYNYSINHLVVQKGDQEFNLHSDANSRDVFELLVGNFLLVVLTLGFGASWAMIRSTRFTINHCVIPAEFNLDTIEDEPDVENEAPSSHWLDKWNPSIIC